MTTRRLITAIFIAAFAVGLLWGGQARGMVTSFLIEGADETRNESLTQSFTLGGLLDALGPHFVVDMADSLRHAPLTYPAGLQVAFDSLLSHFVLDMADSNRFNALQYPFTLIGDATPPQEEGTPEVIPSGASSVKIRWQTNEFSRGTIEFGTQSGQYTRTATEPLYVKDHELTLIGLAAEETYYYRIANVDPSGNSGLGPERSFSIGSQSKVIYLPLAIAR